MGQLKNRLILIAMMLALPLAGLVFFGLLTEHNFNTLPYFTERGEMQRRTLEAQRVGEFELTNQNGEPFSSESLKGKVWIAAFFGTDAPHVAQVTKQLRVSETKLARATALLEPTLRDLRESRRDKKL